MVKTENCEALVSVIIPVYNVENNIAYCIESVLRQTYKNLEILIIDDGSTDNSYNICKKYANTDNRIKVIHQENHGILYVRNFGVK